MTRRAPGEAVLLVSSSGGVLLDLLALRPWWAPGPVRWVAVPSEDTRENLRDQDVRWVPELAPERGGALVVALWDALRDLRARRPRVVVSAGSGVALPWFVAARVLGVPALWVETLNVLDRPGLAAQACGRLATSVVVQHPHLLQRHRRCVLVGELY